MPSGSQSNPAPGPRRACLACPEAPPDEWTVAGFRPNGAKENPASRRFPAQHPLSKRLARATPAASRTKLRADVRDVDHAGHSRREVWFGSQPELHGLDVTNVRD